MKLRIKGDSLRLRISPSEMDRLLQTGRIEDTIHFGASPESHLTYALESQENHESLQPSIRVRHMTTEVAVIMSSVTARNWAAGSDVGVYEVISVGHRRLEIAVEKDFACLDVNQSQNQDTFPNPKQGNTC